jgi:hypothetical protein
MSDLVHRRRAIVLAALVALLTAVLVQAAPASAATLYACVKKNGSAHIFKTKPKCRKGETKLSWNTAGRNGSNGLPGAQGLTGAPGANGAQGAKGAEGPSGASLKPLVPLSLTLENAWSDANFGTLGYAKDASGIVHLFGALVHTGAANSTMLTLPAGFRPTGDIDVPVVVFGPAAGALRVNSDGTVSVLSGSTTFVSLESVTFLAG